MVIAKVCTSKCPKGIQKREEIMENCDSVFDAVWEMTCFINECSENCVFNNGGNEE